MVLFLHTVQFTISKYGSHEVLGQQSELRISPKIFVAHSSNFDENKKLVEEKQRLRDKEKELRDRRNQTKEARAALQKLKETLKARQEQLRALSVEEALLRTALQGLRGALGKVDAELHETQQKLQENLTLLEGRLTCFRDAMRDLTRAKETLQEECGLSTLDPQKMSPEERDIPDQLEKLFIAEKIPDEKEAVARLLEEEKVKLNIASVDGSKDEITEWKEPVEELIRKINVNYSKFFALLGCAGEVYLDVPEDPCSSLIHSAQYRRVWYHDHGQLPSWRATTAIGSSGFLKVSSGMRFRNRINKRFSV
ncbi:hypothetical protein ANCCEY_01337 [Ancylostoma ceylanicum]|uniref:Uncharacterized protein n=1 Tax=Ancylostoma ceylanicum TaxID=53326 RepID=A0A0D6MCU4_9BILA|nr:hypothetical protein ANCCEY_01337 [Ancylostoma ceylanicum]